MRRAAWIVTAVLGAVAACDSVTSYGGGGGGVGGGPAGQIVVGNDFFRSSHNGTRNPAVDTVSTGSTVTWTWTATGAVEHNVQSLASPSFTSSAIQSGNGRTYAVTFGTPGTYQYDCIVHGSTMRGTIVVRDPAP